MDRAVYEEYRALQDSGVKIEKASQIRPNNGSETLKHLTAKTVVAHIALQNGYRVDSEVEIVQNKEVVGQTDVLLWGHPDRLNYAIEVEVSPTEEVIQDKKERYVDGTAIQEIQIINVTEMPVNVLQASEQIANELGLKL